MALELSALLRELASGEWVSGEELGAGWSVSRAAVSKQLNRWQPQLESMGVVLESERGRGYRLSAVIDLLDEECLHDAPLPVFLHLSLDSTQLEARRLLNSQAAPFAVVAEQQLQGLGRRGRSWNSNFAEGLWWTMAVDVPCAPSQLGGLSLAVGVALAQCLEREVAAPVQLKWPNDLLLGGNKLGGVLLEVSGEAEGPSRVLLGVGLNTGSEPPALDDRRAASLELPRQQGVRSALLKHLLGACWDVLQRYPESGFAPWRTAWQERHAWRGQWVTVSGGVASQEQSGECLGVDEQGALLLAVGRECRRIVSGEVSLRCR